MPSVNESNLLLSPDQKSDSSDLNHSVPSDCAINMRITPNYQKIQVILTEIDTNF